jgi:Secretion system C-terminal sorting domain
MKQFIILFAITFSAGISFADQSFKITTNTSWASQNYSVNSGKSSSFTISSGATLSINQSGVSCYACSFTGGNINISSNFTCQSCTFSSTTISMGNATLTLQSSLNTFSSVKFTLTGSAEILADAAMSISNSTFTFSNTSELFNNGGSLSISASTLNFNDSSYLLANAGPISLQNSTEIMIGSGAATSKAYIKMNGPGLNVYDNSGIVLGNDNNYYFNWSPYTAATTNTSISTTPNTLNCGGTNPNSCQSPLVYGPATINASGLGTFTILPVSLSGFSANLTGSEVELSWTTRQETNSDYFSVERSENGSTWEEIGTVSAKGNSNTVSDYAFTDKTPISGINYYRLKMVNIDNSFSYSGVEIVRTTAVKEISFFPNPATTTVNVSLTGTENATSIELMTISGQLLTAKRVNAANGTTISLDVRDCARGMYIIRVINADGSAATSKLAVTH